MTKICCMNCDCFWCDIFSDIAFCIIDKETIKEGLEQIKFCNAYSEWFGAVE